MPLPSLTVDRRKVKSRPRGIGRYAHRAQQGNGLLANRLQRCGTAEPLIALGNALESCAGSAP